MDLTLIFKSSRIVEASIVEISIWFWSCWSLVKIASMTRFNDCLDRVTVGWSSDFTGDGTIGCVGGNSDVIDREGGYNDNKLFTCCNNSFTCSWSWLMVSFFLWISTSVILILDGAVEIVGCRIVAGIGEFHVVVAWEGHDCTGVVVVTQGALYLLLFAV